MHTPVIAFVLAVGVGNRLLPLTDNRAKPAISSAGKYQALWIWHLTVSSLFLVQTTFKEGKFST
jgi:ADP-glucose pyrophosphorylase